MPRLVGLILTFAAIMTVIALGPGAGTPAVAVLQTATATNTSMPSSTSTSTTTASTTPTSTVTSTPTATSTPGPATAPILGFPTSTCNSFPNPTTASVLFSWTGPANVSAIYLDLSLFDNNFSDGTYITVVLPAGTTSYTWNGIQAGIAHFWRTTGQGLNGNWVMSDFQRFTPCGTQRLLGVEYTCTGGGRASVAFRWAPSSSPANFLFLDISLFNNNFAPNTFLGAGPLPPAQQALVWGGILANLVHYYRVNAFSIFGWGPSFTGSFVAQCPL